ncbi:MAG: hypothetical protein JWS10_3389 [Cypionkella sp.]|nr:hypothetical protein [Cypionkella sp.]
MRMDNLEPDLIEQQLQRDRAALKASLSALGDRFSVQGVAGNLMTQARQIGGVARANPALVSLAGAGLAWYLLSRKHDANRVDTEGLNGTKYEAHARWEDEGGPTMPLEDPDFDWVAEAEALRLQANATLHGLEAKAMDGIEYAKQRAAVFADLARDVRKSMHRGLDQLSTAAQERIVAAREAAYEAQLSLRNASSKAVNDHPIAIISAALALGAAICAVVRRRPSGERKMAKERDRLLEETRDLLSQERQRAHTAMDILAGSRSARQTS